MFFSYLTYYLIEKKILQSNYLRIKALGLVLILLLVLGFALLIKLNYRNVIFERTFVSLNKPVDNGFDGGDAGLASSMCPLEKQYSKFF